ncbi:MAG TPA: ABC transporter ATP-binding protein [Nitrospiraceae bacterium]|nr:ABC transporter ATP-binding protein [Nitrospiraceae bacterium]
MKPWSYTKQIIDLLEIGERRQLYVLLGAITLMGLIDVIGISSVLPFMAVLAKPDVIQTAPVLHTIYDRWGFVSPNRFLFFLGLIALVTITLTNLFTLFVSRAILRFCYLTGHALSERMLRGYLSRPYEFFLMRNSSSLMLNVMGEVTGVVQGILFPGMQVVAKCVVAMCVLTFVVLMQPGLALGFAAVLGGAYVVLFAFVRKRVTRLGARSQDANRERYRLTTEVFAGIKDLRLLAREMEYFDRIRQASREYAVNQSATELIAMAPRYALEAIAFGAVLMLVLFLLAVERDVSRMVPLLTLYAFASYRLLPAFQQVFSSLTHIRFNLPSLDVVTRELKELRHSKEQDETPVGKIAPRALAFDREIALERVIYRYEGRESPVLQAISFAIKKNTTVGLVGETGSGKTTLVDIILGLLEPVDGKLLVDGSPITAGNVRAWRRNLGYVPQQIFLSDDTVARNIAFGVPQSAINRARVEEVGRIANIHDFIVSQLPQGYDTPVGERGVRLSGGQRQRIGIARALYHDPSVLVMDEATSALDGITEDAIIDAIHALAHRKTIILIAHRFATVQDCDIIYMLDRGRLIDQGSYDELIVRSEQFRAMAKV